MPSPMKRTVPGKALSKRRVVNVHSLQLMVGSGVVRRADSIPPHPPRRARVQRSDESRRVVCNEAVQEQGWLSRVIFGPKPHPTLTRRSSLDGGQ